MKNIKFLNPNKKLVTELRITIKLKKNLRFIVLNKKKID